MYHRSDWTPDQDAMLATLSPDEVQRLTGRSKRAIVARRVKLKQKGVKLPDLRTSEQRTRLGRAVWTAEADDLVHRHPPHQAAALIGVSRAAVHRRRKALGLPLIIQQRKPKPPARRVLRPWTEAEILLLVNLTPDEAVEQLPHRTVSAIHTQRCLLRRRGIKLAYNDWRARS
jgi:hypothetical protein